MTISSTELPAYCAIVWACAPPLVALVLAVVATGMAVPAPVSTGDVLTGHSRHDGYDPMRTRQGMAHDVLTLVPDSAITCWIEDNGYGAEKICGARAGLAELA